MKKEPHWLLYLSIQLTQKIFDHFVCSGDEFFTSPEDITDDTLFLFGCLRYPTNKRPETLWALHLHLLLRVFLIHLDLEVPTTEAIRALHVCDELSQFFISG